MLYGVLNSVGTFSSSQFCDYWGTRKRKSRKRGKDDTQNSNPEDIRDEWAERTKEGNLKSGSSKHSSRVKFECGPEPVEARGRNAA